MPRMSIITEGDGCWPELAGKLGTDAVITLDPEALVQLALLEGGTVGGRGSVTLRLDLPDGRVVLAQTSLRLLRRAVELFNAAAAGR